MQWRTRSTAAWKTLIWQATPCNDGNVDDDVVDDDDDNVGDDEDVGEDEDDEHEDEDTDDDDNED